MLAVIFLLMAPRFYFKELDQAVAGGCIFSNTSLIKVTNTVK